MEMPFSLECFCGSVISAVSSHIEYLCTNFNDLYDFSLCLIVEFVTNEASCEVTVEQVIENVWYASTSSRQKHARGVQRKEALTLSFVYRQARLGYMLRARCHKEHGREKCHRKHFAMFPSITLTKMWDHMHTRLHPFLNGLKILLQTHRFGYDIHPLCAEISQWSLRASAMKVFWNVMRSRRERKKYSPTSGRWVFRRMDGWNAGPVSVQKAPRWWRAANVSAIRYVVPHNQEKIYEIDHLKTYQWQQIHFRLELQCDDICFLIQQLDKYARPKGLPGENR